MAAKRKSNNKSRMAYQEFGTSDNSAAMARATPDLPPHKQNLKVQTTRAGRKGKTVTVISGFQHQPETLAKLLKQLKAQCGSGGTVKEQNLEIQGDHRQKLVEILTKLGYKVKAI